MTGPHEIRDASLHVGSTTKPPTPDRSSGKHAEHQPPIQTEDAVNLSPISQELESLQEAISLLPEIRKERVEQLRQKLDSGTYQVSSEKVADRIIQETIRNSKQLPE